MLKAEACWITGYNGDDEDGDGDGNVDDDGDGGCGDYDDDDSDNDGDCCGGGAPQSMLKAKSCWMRPIMMMLILRLMLILLLLGSSKTVERYGIIRCG